MPAWAGSSNGCVRQNTVMIKRWCVYLAVLGACLGLYAAYPVWMAWMALLTAAGSPLICVMISALWGEADPLGLFRFPGKKELEYDCELRPYRPKDSLGCVHWKHTAKTGVLLVRQERSFGRPKGKGVPGIVPVAVCFGVVFCLFPPWRYQLQMQRLQALLQKKTEVRFELNAGPRTASRQALLDVVSSQSQTLYLRERAFEIYDGTAWCASGQEQAPLSGDVRGTVTVESRTAQAVIPCCTAVQGKPPGDCLQLPGETKVWAQALAEGKTPEQIQSFVRSCAGYEENPVAPAGTDFARWFLEESDGGYCVHFATAAVVLLRAAGIPARFVTGYAVTVQAGLRKTVTGADAHTWAEYWDGEVWRILEATPTAEAAVLPEMSEKEESSALAVVWALLCLVIFVLSVQILCRKKEDPRLKALQQKAAFSREGLTEEETQLFAQLRKKSKGFPRKKARAHILFFFAKH